MRDKSIDALKGLAITLVVLGHATAWTAGLIGKQSWVPSATAPHFVFILIYSFHMPLFAFVSGYVLYPPREQPLGTQIMRRVRGLLVPYLSWAVVMRVASQAVAPDSSERPGALLLDALLGRGDLSLWFLYALFICTSVLTCLAFLTRAPRLRWLLPASALVIMVRIAGVQVPNLFFLSDVLWIYPFVVLGYMMRPLKAAILNHRWRVVAIGLTAFLPLFYFRYPMFIPRLQPVDRLVVAMHDVGLRGGIALSGTLPYLCATAAVVALYGLYAGRRGRAIEAQAWLGRKSLGIYAIHASALKFLFGAGVDNVLLLFAGSLGVSILLTALLERIPLVNSLLLGQRGARRTHAASGPQLPVPTKEDTRAS